MKVRELMHALSDCDPEAEVVTDNDDWPLSRGASHDLKAITVRRVESGWSGYPRSTGHGPIWVCGQDWIAVRDDQRADRKQQGDVQDIVVLRMDR